MTVKAFLQAFSAEVGAPAPSADEAAALLELASVAAHASERKAAPLPCWMSGASVLSIGELLSAARRVADKAA